MKGEHAFMNKFKSYIREAVLLAGQYLDTLIQ